ncbi:type II toxin-antitoxin system death-on-curing family toxin [Candidatus Protochlamydia amoebophila]|uniref:Toxin Doc n=1 Tax=Candidatus Protochlamydia amoebophila TaxID=362787 RepID=A0A0C1JXL1_9BACT|nr:type II toxin-antitoxin system death-on-curing family toxin [Candidatus Protochlamydia amoebophila]KIC71977.1 Toxin Doc [Candidatus Protochlamydia amoebophila]
MIFLSVEEVILIHDHLVSEYGGLHGIRDMGLLVSAIEMPKTTMFGEYLHESIFDKASAYLFHIVCNHAFLDGNKRTGAAVTLIFLSQNDCKMKYDMREFEEMVCKVAQGLFSKEEISNFLKRQDK